MRMTHLLVCWSALVLAACSVDRAEPETIRNGPAPAAAAPQDGHRYGIRSARLVAVSDRPGQGTPDTSVFLFDQYGRMERSEQVVELPTRDRGSVRNPTIVIRDGNTLTTIDPVRKVARVTKLEDAGVAGFIDFMRLPDAKLAEYHVVRNGRDTLLGRQCDVFRIDDPDNDMHGTYHVWMNIPLQIDVTIRGARMTTRPIALEENIAIDPAMFTVPTTYRILDNQ